MENKRKKPKKKKKKRKADNENQKKKQQKASKTKYTVSSDHEAGIATIPWESWLGGLKVPSDRCGNDPSATSIM